MGIGFPVLVASIFIGNGLRTLALRKEYSAKMTQREALMPLLTTLFAVLGVVQLIVALPLGYLVFWLMLPYK